MTERQREILYAIIEEYAELATPVGSVTLAKLFDCSSATIRAEMVKLEAMGYITQPHTSAGRVPTDAGYRLYVNSLQERIDHQGNDPKVIEEDPLYATEERHTRALATRIQAQSQADYAIRAAVDSLVTLTGNLGLATIGDQVYISGFGNLFAQPEFSQAEQVQAVGKLLDNIKPWLREVQPNEAINVYIGTENPVGKASNVSLIISRFRSPYSDRSYIGVLGPTRQSYKRVMSLVRHAVVGYACAETSEHLPLEYVLARDLCKYLFERHPFDGKTQITVEIKYGAKGNFISAHIKHIVISWSKVATKQLCADLTFWINQLPKNIIVDKQTGVSINPAGDWDTNGFDADSGLTGRKLIVDNYGPRVPIGGGAFSGKDGTKVDRSAAYYARKIAVDYLQKYEAHEVYVYISYALGRVEPVDATAFIDGKVHIVTEYDLSPRHIIDELRLTLPFFEQRAKWGHFSC